MKKKPRGKIDFVTDGKNKMVACCWMDNSVVTIASTVHVSNTSTKVKRYSRKEKKTVEINCLSLV